MKSICRTARLLLLRRCRGRVDLKMRWLALEKFAAAEFTDKDSIARRDLPANGSDATIRMVNEQIRVATEGLQ